MGFTGAVVTDDEQAVIVLRLGILKLGEHQIAQAVGHVGGNHIGADEFLCLGAFVGLAEFDDRFNRLEVDQFAIFHVVKCSWSLSSATETTGKPFTVWLK